MLQTKPHCILDSSLVPYKNMKKTICTFTLKIQEYSPEKK